jgi:hypothetical protein
MESLEIVSKRRQAERIASSKQATAAIVYFNMAKGKLDIDNLRICNMIAKMNDDCDNLALWQVNAVRETAKTLDMLCVLLKQSDTTNEESEELSVSQTRKLIGLSTVGLMRIYAISGQYAMAVDKGIIAFTDYTALDQDAIQHLALVK